METINKIKIGIDIDETVLGFYEYFSTFCNKAHDFNFSIEEYASDFLNILGSKEKIIGIKLWRILNDKFN